MEDEELRAAMSAKGLGTPATRAAIIEGLIHENYIERIPVFKISLFYFSDGWLKSVNRAAFLSIICQ